jgi:hypothetical protein
MPKPKIAADVPKNIPTTGRTPAFLAKRYGFANLQALIDDIPRNATVLDVGAGLSLLGHAVAKKRRDVTWINIDPFYTDAQVKLAQADAPINVSYIADDITNPSADTKKLQAHRIYSYWMLPHLSLTGDEPANRAVGAMWDILTDNGHMYLGPNRPYHLASNFKRVRLVKMAKVPRQQAIQEVVALTRLPAYMRIVQNGVNLYLHKTANTVLKTLLASQMRRARKTIHKT